MNITKNFIQKVCFEETIPMWNMLPETFPGFLEEIKEEEKKRNEETLNRFIPVIKNMFSRFPSGKEEQKIWKQEVEALLSEFIAEEKILDISTTLGAELYGAFERETKRFLRESRVFDPNMGMEALWQALRNYFIYAMINDFQGEEQSCKDSAFAYSLLYPYTDNYIDNPKRTSREKESYNQMIAKVLKGEDYQPKNTDEQKVCQLLHLVREFYGEEKREEISGMLLLMLEAQEESMRQQKQKLSVSDILRISTYKGGISVLNDYLMSEDHILAEEVVFYLKFGFILQLSDDLQDIEEDCREGSRTIMSVAAEDQVLEEAVNRLLHFTYHTMQDFQLRNNGLKSFAIHNCLQMILSTTVTNQKYFSTEYLKKVEKYLPWHISFLETFQVPKRGKAADQKKIQKKQMQILDVILG